MKQSNFNVITLEASKDKYLTQVEDVNIKDRIVASIVVIGRNDSPENYKEITKEEGNKYVEEQKTYFTASLDNNK